MAFSFNNVCVGGVLVCDPEIINNEGDATLCEISIAVDCRVSGGSQREVLKVISKGEAADVLLSHLKEGDSLVAHGAFGKRDGELCVYADHAQIISGPKPNRGGKAPLLDAAWVMDESQMSGGQRASMAAMRELGVQLADVGERVSELQRRLDERGGHNEQN